MTVEAARLDAWREFVGLVRRRVRMYTVSGGLLEVSALFVGFDNGIGSSVFRQFQEWISARHDGHAELPFVALVIHEMTRDHESPWNLRTLPGDVDVQAALVLLDLLDQFLAESHGEDSPRT